MKKGVLNAGQSLAHGVLSRAGLFLINLLAARNLQTHDYGVFGFFLSVVASLATVAAFGFGVTCNSYVAKFDRTDADYARSVVASCFFFSSLLVIAVSLLCYPFFRTEAVAGAIGGDIAAWFFVLSLIWLICIASMGEGTLYGAGAYSVILKNSTAVFFIAIPAAYFSIRYFGLYGGILSILIYRLLFAVGVLRSVKKLGYLRFREMRSQIFPLRSDIWRIFSKFSLPIAMSGLAAGPIIAIAMNMVIGEENGQKQIGLFSWVYQIYLVAVFVPGALSHFFLSKFSKKQEGRLRSFCWSYAFNLIFSAIVAVNLLFFREPILFIAGSDYVSSGGAIYNTMALCVVFCGASAAFIGFWPAVGRGWMVFGMQFIWAGIIVFATRFFLKDGGLALARAFLLAYIFLAVAQPIVLLHLWKNKAI